MGLQEGYTKFDAATMAAMRSVYENSDGCDLKTGGAKSMAPQQAATNTISAPKAAATTFSIS